MTLDSSTASLVASAYERCMVGKPKRVKVRRLAQVMWDKWARYRNGIVEGWCREYLAGLPTETLLWLTEPVGQALIDLGGAVEWPCDDDTREEIAIWTAGGLAAILWMEREGTDEARLPRFTRQDLEARLAQAEFHLAKARGQLTLR